MSLLKSIGRAIGSVARAVAPVASVIPGVGQAVGALGLLGAKHAAKAPAVVATPPPLFSSLSQGATMSMLPAVGPAGPAIGGVLRSILPGAGAVAGVAVRGATAAMRGATAWCRRNPAWCAQVGGTAAIAGMIESGQLPMPRRRRGRGISSRDLRSYRRVHNLLAGFCAPKARIRKAC